ncbi:nucleotide-binding universal stress UspA family protein [Pseudonocardia hierapolitana]|uniref:Nucleotide-binding universal stress UspA family protein n=1 Tax=Pseudonocardia hierapolitana TaxID=1128676 RepID=A0A561T5J7_9PSEU|nr:universal stress protein [Pseudonocardia hierapolitana]TWF82391.1 nucleotide-binding universal stress UspA family protein [Pseudonocardia hierapolitana]
MTVLVGLPRDERATAAVHLGVMLARSLDADLLLCTVVPPPWPPGMARVDAEYQEYLDRSAQEAIEQARRLVPGDRPASFVVARARSTSVGLLDVAREHGARLLVLGSSTAGVLGRVAFGSVADRLLHSSPLPVVLGPRGFRCRADATVRRVTAAFDATEGADELVVAVAGVAARAKAALRVASFAVRPRTPLTAGIGSRAEDAVAREWAAEVERAQRAVLEQVERLPRQPSALASAVGYGSDWAGAIEDIGWEDGDLLAVGSSTAGPLEHVFIGSRSSRIVRHSPVPVVVVPRGAAHALAERAERPA